jgi:dUTP pyrophosphatase
MSDQKTPETMNVVLADGDAKMPVIKTKGSAGFDLYSIEDGIVPARGRTLVKTGVIVDIPDGQCGQIWPRSGLSVKYGIETGAGVIDSDYTAEPGVVLHNLTNDEFHYEKNTRIAQLLIVPIATPALVQVDSIEANDTRQGGFGSTGLK